MNRRRGGQQRSSRQINGWLAIDKPAGITSRDVALRLNRSLHAKKIGHAGTLDSPATGVLVIALGEATKAIQYVMNQNKTYVFVVRFGQATTTDDATGDVIAESDSRPNPQEILDVLDRFRGDIMQVPPDYSAIKIRGRRAADRVRAGESVELAPRPLTVHKLELLRQIDETHAEFEMQCGKGGYVRSIARDLGDALGCHAHVRSLRRTAVGLFRVEDCIDLPESRGSGVAERLRQSMRRLEAGLFNIRAFTCTDEEADKIRVGLPVRLEEGPESDEPISPAWISWEGYAIAIGEFRDGKFHPKRLFNLPYEA